MEVTDGFIDRMKEQMGFDLSAEDRTALKSAFREDGDVSDADMLVMQYHIATEPYAEKDDQVQMLHALTTAYFFRKYPNVTAVAKRVLQKQARAQAEDPARKSGRH